MTRHRASARPDDYAFSPAGELWQINRYWTGLVFGSVAAILQAAHPRVAQGVAEHSDFRNEPLDRLWRTLAAVNKIAFGTRETAEKVREKMAKLHAGVQGEISEGMPGERRYSAFEPELLLWVLATLIDASIRGYELLLEPLNPDRRQGLFQDMREFGEYFGLDRGYGPQSYAEFEPYYQELLADPMIGEHPVCAEVARGIVHPRRPLLARIAGRALDFLAIEGLPPAVRNRLGFRSSWWSRGRWAVFRRIAPPVFRLLPRSLRYYPEAYRAERRLGLV